MPEPLHSADLKALHRYITTDPAKAARSHRFNAKLYEVAAHISLLATLAIMGGTLAMFLGFFGTAPISFGAVCLSLGVAALTSFSTGYFIDSELAEQLCEKWNEMLDISLQKIKHWTEKDVHKFYQDNQCSVKNIPSETSAKLKQMNPEHPLLAIIPLIARYQFTAEKAKELNKKLDQVHKKIAAIKKLPEKDRKKLLEEQELQVSGYEQRIHICQAEHIQCVKFTGLRNTIAVHHLFRTLTMTLKSHEAG